MRFINACMIEGVWKGRKLQQGIFQHDGHIISVVSIPCEYQGHPGITHGGVVASLLDEVMGYAAADYFGAPVFTCRIRVTYLKPTLTNTKYSIIASLDSVENGKAAASAKVLSESNDLTAMATAIFHRSVR